MTGLLLSKSFVAKYGGELNEVAQRVKLKPEILHLPDDPQARMSQADCDRIEVTMQTRDVRFSDYFKGFGDALIAATNLKWAHFHSTAIEQHVFVPPLLARGVKLTTSAGSNGEPVAQTAIAGLLMLARRFPHWLDAQRRHAWEPLRGDAAPADLRGQTVIVVGLGNIGMPVAQFCRALSMHVIGIRRTPKKADDPFDEIYPLAELGKLLPRCQWLVLACPYTKETHHIVNADTLAQLPRGAALINVARGRVVDEPALIDALKAGQVGCAYLDVFEKEPLPADSPLWALPNVIVTPHNASVSAGNDRRSAQIFLANLEKWACGEPLANPHTA
ncbi:MAG: putative D-2-hydroxyacid dehydrogenase [Betaproteobacteria bacterium]|nr:putative D-2-hydroxyacid dehydrogenase [Betaproteobacteria bacterium]